MSDVQPRSTAEHGKPSGTWAECSFEVEGRRVTVSVRRLVHDERQRMAAEIAWFAEGLLTPGVELKTTGWSALLGEVLARHVAITVDEEGVDDADDFWNQVLCRTFEAFGVTNQLYPHSVFERGLKRQ